MASSRFPGKPLAKINGTPMIEMVWKKAIEADIGEVYVACAEIEIYNLIKKIGGNAILTDPNLPSGTDRIHDAFLKLKYQGKKYNIINLQGDMPLIKSEDIISVLEPLKNNYSISTIATDLAEDEFKNPNVTKVEVDIKNNSIGKAKNFFRISSRLYNNTYHHVGLYGYTSESLEDFVSYPKSKNEILLSLEQYRAMDKGIEIGVKYVPNIHLSIDTKEDLITAQNIIKDKNEKD